MSKFTIGEEVYCTINQSKVTARCECDGWYLVRDEQEEEVYFRHESDLKELSTEVFRFILTENFYGAGYRYRRVYQIGDPVRIDKDVAHRALGYTNDPDWIEKINPETQKPIHYSTLPFDENGVYKYVIGMRSEV